MSVGDLAACAGREVEARHDFFVDWFAGLAGEADLMRSRTAFDPGFVRIAPDGTVQDLDAVFSMLAARRGSVPAGALQIETEIETAVALPGDAVQLLYIERQRTPDGPTARRSSALFVADPTAPEGVVWRWLHETWVDQAQA